MTTASMTFSSRVYLLVTAASRVLGLAVTLALQVLPSARSVLATIGKGETH